MKKIISTLFVALCVTGAFAQSCGADGSFACTPTGGPAQGGFQDLNTVPCIEKGVAYDNAIQFTMFSNFEFQGSQNVDSIEFVSIDGLPCGICWAVNQTDKRYSANEDGCLRIAGITNDQVGQYKLALSLKAWINGQLTGLTIPANLVDQTGIRLYTRVKDNGSSNCPNIDTSSNANNIVAATGCPVGIKDVAANVNDMTVKPNPMTGTANVQFTVAKAGVYHLTLTDITGKLVMSRELDAHAGGNQTTINRDNLAEGVYFLTLSDGQNGITKRLSVTQ